MFFTSGTSSMLEVRNGTGTAAASSAWKPAVKPQVVINAAQPSAARSRAVWI